MPLLATLTWPSISVLELEEMGWPSGLSVWGVTIEADRAEECACVPHNGGVVYTVM